MHINMNDFIEQLMFSGNIVQDSDETVGWPEREDRFNKYIELLESINGNEGLDIARAVIKSMQAEEDYGAYQTSQGTLGKFPAEVYTSALILELPALIKSQSEWAGELLCSLANSLDTAYEYNINHFNKLLKDSDQETKDIINKYIEAEEDDGWLEHRVGVLGVKNA